MSHLRQPITQISNFLLPRWYSKEGQRAFDCIKSGFGLGLGGLLLSGGNYPLVVTLLGILAGPTGCGNVVHLELASGLLDLGKLNTLKSALGI